MIKKLPFDIESIINIFAKYTVKKFNYTIQLNSLNSIFTFGILSRNRVKRVGSLKDNNLEFWINYQRISSFREI